MQSIEAARKSLIEAGFTEAEFSQWANGWTLETSDCPEYHVAEFIMDMSIG